RARGRLPRHARGAHRGRPAVARRGREPGGARRAPARSREPARGARRRAAPDDPRAQQDGPRGIGAQPRHAHGVAVARGGGVRRHRQGPRRTPGRDRERARAGDAGRRRPCSRGNRGRLTSPLLALGTLLIHMVGARIYPRPTWAGKAATVLQILTVLGGVFGHYMKLRLVPAPLLWLAAGFTLLSGLQYLVQGMRFLNAAQDAE